MMNKNLICFLYLAITPFIFVNEAGACLCLQDCLPDSGSQQQSCPFPPPPKIQDISKEAQNIERMVFLPVLFASNSSEIAPDYFPLLDEIAGNLSKMPRQIEIQGFADTFGSVQHNKMISLKRAEAVKAYLVKKGVSESSLIHVGLGSMIPVGKSGSSIAVNNRRVQFVPAVPPPPKTP